MRKNGCIKFYVKNEYGKKYYFDNLRGYEASVYNSARKNARDRLLKKYSSAIYNLILDVYVDMDFDVLYAYIPSNEYVRACAQCLITLPNKNKKIQKIAMQRIRKQIN